MQISEIVGNPGRFVLHRGHVFKGEAWLLEFRMWLTTADSLSLDSVTTCTVSFGSGETYAWFVHNQISTLVTELVQVGPQLQQFVVTTETIDLPVDADESPQTTTVLKLVALKLEGTFIEVYHDYDSALSAAKPFDRSVYH